MSQSKLVLKGLLTSILDMSKLVLIGLFTSSALGLSKLLFVFIPSLRRLPSGQYQAAGVLSCMKPPSMVW